MLCESGGTEPSRLVLHGSEVCQRLNVLTCSGTVPRNFRVPSPRWSLIETYGFRCGGYRVVTGGLETSTGWRILCACCAGRVADRAPLAVVASRFIVRLLHYLVITDVHAEPRDWIAATIAAISPGRAHERVFALRPYHPSARRDYQPAAGENLPTSTTGSDSSSSASRTEDT
jgi:hypothetical protein